MLPHDWIVPDWPAPQQVRALMTTRAGGVSLPPYKSLNLALHVGDDPAAVLENRARLAQVGCPEAAWLNQVHGTQVVEASASVVTPSEADAAWTQQTDFACAVMTADCLPVLFCDRAGTVVAAAHAGWRGLQAGVLEATVASMRVPPSEVLAWLGPAIGPRAFEVGAEVRAAFLEVDSAAQLAFVPAAQGKWVADIYQLARQRLLRSGLGTDQVFGGGRCTFEEAATFFSYRRDRNTGRMAALIWLSPQR